LTENPLMEGLYLKVTQVKTFFISGGGKINRKGEPKNPAATVKKTGRFLTSQGVGQGRWGN